MIQRINREFDILENEKKRMDIMIRTYTVGSSLLNSYIATLKSVTLTTRNIATGFVDALSPLQVSSLFETLNVVVNELESKVIFFHKLYEETKKTSNVSVERHQTQNCNTCGQNIQESNIRQTMITLEENTRQQFHLAAEQFKKIAEEPLFTKEENNDFEQQLYCLLSHQERVLSMNCSQVEEFKEVMESTIAELTRIQEVELTNKDQDMLTFVSTNRINEDVSQFVQKFFSKKIPPWIHKMFQRMVASYLVETNSKKKNQDIQTEAFESQEMKKLKEMMNEKKCLQKEMKSLNEELRELKIMYKKLEEINTENVGAMASLSKNIRSRTFQKEIKEKSLKHIGKIGSTSRVKSLNDEESSIGESIQLNESQHNYYPTKKRNLVKSVLPQIKKNKYESMAVKIESKKQIKRVSGETFKTNTKIGTSKTITINEMHNTSEPVENIGKKSMKSIAFKSEKSQKIIENEKDKDEIIETKLKEYAENDSKKKRSMKNISVKKAEIVKHEQAIGEKRKNKNHRASHSSEIPVKVNKFLNEKDNMIEIKNKLEKKITENKFETEKASKDKPFFKADQKIEQKEIGKLEKEKRILPENKKTEKISEQRAEEAGKKKERGHKENNYEHIVNEVSSLSEYKNKNNKREQELAQKVLEDIENKIFRKHSSIHNEIPLRSELPKVLKINERETRSIHKNKKQIETDDKRKENKKILKIERIERKPENNTENNQNIKADLIRKSEGSRNNFEFENDEAEVEFRETQNGFVANLEQKLKKCYQIEPYQNHYDLPEKLEITKFGNKKQSIETETDYENENIFHSEEAQTKVFEILKNNAAIPKEITYQQFSNLISKANTEIKQTQIKNHIINLNQISKPKEEIEDHENYLDSLKENFSQQIQGTVYGRLFVNKTYAYKYEQSMAKSYHKKITKELNEEEKEFCEEMFNSLNQLKKLGREIYNEFCSLIRYPYQTLYNKFEVVSFVSEMSFETFEYFFKKIIWIHRNCIKPYGSCICPHIENIENVLSGLINHA